MGLEIGQSVGPVELVNLGGHPRVMNNYADHVVTAVIFLSARCDATLARIADINAMLRGEDAEDSVFVGICSNSEESGEELRTFCQNRGVVFPVYRDIEGKAARQFGARVTPEAFLLDKAGKLVYRGGLDGLAEAVKLQSARKKVKQPQTEAVGTPIDRPGPKRDIPNPYGAPAFASELVFTQIPGAPVHHCSTITETGAGDLLCLWYGGSYESAEDQVLFLSRLKKGERFWSEPRVVVSNPDQPPGNPIIFKDTTNRLWMVWGRMEGSRPTRRGSGWTKCRLVSMTSTDNGETWGEEREWANAMGWLPRNPPMTLKDGTLLLPMSVSTKAGEGGGMWRLEPDGNTWTPLGIMKHGEQLSVIERDNGDLFALSRSRPFVLASVSSDKGASWGKTRKTDLRCPDSGTVMIRLKSGRVLLAHNDNNGEDRSTLALRVSEDEGRTWKYHRILEMDLDLVGAEFSYPCLIQAADDTIHISYTFRRFSIKHAAFNEDWLLHIERPN